MDTKRRYGSGRWGHRRTVGCVDGGIFPWYPGLHIKIAGGCLRTFLPPLSNLTIKSAHTALAVKACLLGGNSYTKCSITFVNIAVAISAWAGGGPKNGFAPRPDPKNGFAPRPEYGGVFDIFRGFLGVWAQEGIEMEFWVILVAFRQWKNGQKWKKHCT